MPINLFLILFFLFNTPSPDRNKHKFYVSTTLIEFKSETKSLHITSQIFTNDIESVLKQKDEDLSLDPDSNSESIDELIVNYFKKTLTFANGEKKIDYIFLGKEYKNDITKCYMELKFTKVPNKIELFNGLFLSLFEEQQNIVHFKNLNKSKSYLLHQKKPSVSLVLIP